MPPRNLADLALAPSHLQLLQSLLQTHVPHAQVWVYGSRVKGGHHECSDLDIVLRDPQNPAQSLIGMDDLKTALQDSSLPILVEVHEWARFPAAFHRNIERDYVELQGGRVGSNGL